MLYFYKKKPLERSGTWENSFVMVFMEMVHKMCDFTYPIQSRMVCATLVKIILPMYDFNILKKVIQIDKLTSRIQLGSLT